MKDPEIAKTLRFGLPRYARKDYNARHCEEERRGNLYQKTKIRNRGFELA